MKYISFTALFLMTSATTLFGGDQYSTEESKFYACTQKCMQQHISIYGTSNGNLKKAEICADTCTAIFKCREKDKHQKELMQALLMQAQAQQAMTQALIDYMPKQNN